jgi:hypothetical protein
MTSFRFFELEPDHLDTFGSLVAEKTADYLQTQLQMETTGSGLKITNRYSPGYCNWPVAGQQQLFELLPAGNPCRFSLTESMLMMPVKSVSGIVGIGKNVKRHEYACNVCSDKNCVYRKALYFLNNLSAI